MTERQKFGLYFPLWRRVCEVNGWCQKEIRNQKSEIGNSKSEIRTATGMLERVMVFGEQRAAMEHRGLKVEDLRHGAHWVALGYDKSSADLTNQELDRVATVFRLLIYEDDLDARMAWDGYQDGRDEGAQRRVDWFIKHAAPEAYVRAVSADKYGTRNWEGLSAGQKANLAMTLKERARAWRRRARSPKTETRDPKEIRSPKCEVGADVRERIDCPF